VTGCYPGLRAVRAAESLAGVLARLDGHGRDGLPVVSGDGQRIEGWVTGDSVLQALARQSSAAREVAGAAWAGGSQVTGGAEAPSLPGYLLAEITVAAGSPAAGRGIPDVTWPPGCSPVSVLRSGRLQPASHSVVLQAGDQVRLLVPAQAWPDDGKGPAGQSPGPATRAAAGAEPVPESTGAGSPATPPGSAAR
jgi:CIC family chloride channel protein